MEQHNMHHHHQHQHHNPHSHHNNTALHWGYAATTATSTSTTPLPTTQQNHWAPPPTQTPTHSLKRTLSESDCEELYSEESSKEQISPSENGSCQLMSRKKRRGVIEKKRRDRINSSLSELKRLVPSAYEKQGSAKLEKAEILQLTVEHLKNMQGKGMDTLGYDPQRFAMDYHIIGFRECAAEVARYLVTIEGMDIQDPLRLRLMSHLQYFVQQRELSAKGCTVVQPSTNGWPTHSVNTTVAYQTNCAVAPYQSYSTVGSVSHAGSSNSSYVPNLSSTLHQYPTLATSTHDAHALVQQQHHHQQQQLHSHSHQQHQTHVGRSTSVGSAQDTIVNHTNNTQQSTNSGQNQTATTQQQQQQHTTHGQHSSNTHDTHQQPSNHQQQQQQQANHQNHLYASHEHAHVTAHGQEHQGATYIELTSSHRNPTTIVPADTNLTYGLPAQYPAATLTQTYNANSGVYVTAPGSKPYRPWGAEMAY